VKYAWIKENRDTFPVKVMCRVLDVSTSGYYDWCDRVPSPRSIRHQRICAAVRQVFVDSHENYGSSKVTRALAKTSGLESACRNTVRNAMRKLGLKSRVAKRFVPTTTQADPSREPAKNLLNQDFQAIRPNQKWVCDITYLRTNSGWVYLAVVLDLYSRKVVGWAVGDSLETCLVARALQNAIETRRPVGSQLLIHSDRGCQYTSEAYQRTLRTMGITCSMSRTGNCYDNAVMERFFWSLKHEWTNHHEYADEEAARVAVFKYVETFYNTVRLHQTLGYRTPTEVEAEYAPANAA